MIGIICFMFVITFSYVIARGIAFSNRNIDKEKNKFWDKEAKANSVRKADISNLDYIIVPISSLPVDKLYSFGLSDMADELKELAALKILNLSGMTNTDIKLAYGPANLEALTEYDENYLHLIRLLDTVGNELAAKDGCGEYAISILQYAIDIGSDISTSFTGLAALYASRSKNDKVEILLYKARQLKSLNKDSVIRKLNDIKSAMR